MLIALGGQPVSYGGLDIDYGPADPVEAGQVWRDGVWRTGVWRDGVWSTSGPAPIPNPTVESIDIDDSSLARGVAVRVIYAGD